MTTLIVVAAAVLGVALIAGSATVFAVGRRHPYVGKHRAPF